MLKFFTPFTQARRARLDSMCNSFGFVCINMGIVGALYNYNTDKSKFYWSLAFFALGFVLHSVRFKTTEED